MAEVSSPASAVPLPVLVVFRGIGQIFFQENALTGLLFVVGIAVTSPLQAGGLVVGSAIGAATAWLLKFDKGELNAGIFGFNPALVGIASLFFFDPGAVSVGLMLAGCVAATLLTRLMRGFVPFPTYTTPFIVTTWVVILLGRSMGASATSSFVAPLVPTASLGFVVDSTAHGIGQVMFQASLWAGILFLVGLVISDREHAAWALIASVLGMVVTTYHLEAGAKAIDPEFLVERDQFENIALGLYGYNATLAAVALFLWRRSAIPALLGIVLSVPLTEIVPRLGLPALTAPFVLAVWLVMIFGWLEGKAFPARTATA